MFQAEARAAACLQHPNIVAVHEIGEYDGQHFFSMDYIEGKSLKELLCDGPLPPRRAARYVQLIAQAIYSAHQHGILHRDLKPYNVLIDATDQPRVTDFGLAKRLEGDSDLTLSGQVIGSPAFMAPEQVAGRQREVETRTDVYGLGAVLYQLLTGCPPFTATTLHKTMAEVLHSEPQPPRTWNPDIPRDLETICLKCLEKETSQRYGSAQALGEDLARYLDDRPIAARPVGKMERLWRWCRRRPAISSLGAAVIFLGLSLSGVALAFWTQKRAAFEESRRANRTGSTARSIYWKRATRSPSTRPSR